MGHFSAVKIGNDDENNLSKKADFNRKCKYMTFRTVLSSPWSSSCQRKRVVGSVSIGLRGRWTMPLSTCLFYQGYTNPPSGLETERAKKWSRIHDTRPRPLRSMVGQRAGRKKPFLGASLLNDNLVVGFSNSKVFYMMLREHALSPRSEYHIKRLI